MVNFLLDPSHLLPCKWMNRPSSRLLWVSARRRPRRYRYPGSREAFLCLLLLFHTDRLRWTRRHHSSPLKRSQADRRAAISCWRAHRLLEPVNTDEAQEPWWIDLAWKRSCQSLRRVQISKCDVWPQFQNIILICILTLRRVACCPSRYSHWN